MAPRKQFNARQRKAPPAVKAYVKRAIESKRDRIATCGVDSQNIGYDSPLILDVTPLGAKSQGQDIDFSGLNLNMTVSKSGTTYTRVMLLQWFGDSSDAIPTLATVLCSGAGANAVIQGYNQAHVHQKFVVIKDKLILTTTNKNDGSAIMKMNVKTSQLQRKVFRSTGSAGYKNQLYLLAFTNSLVSSPAIFDVGYTFYHKSRD